jgi:hypothetical protein
VLCEFRDINRLFQPGSLWAGAIVLWRGHVCWINFMTQNRQSQQGTDGATTENKRNNKNMTERHPLIDQETGETVETGETAESLGEAGEPSRWLALSC